MDDSVTSTMKQQQQKSVNNLLYKISQTSLTRREKLQDKKLWCLNKQIISDSLFHFLEESIFILVPRR